MAPVRNCVTTDTTAAPQAPYNGIQIKLKIILKSIPTNAILFSTPKLPFAVSNVPKMYVDAIGMNPIIRTWNICDEAS